MASSKKTQVQFLNKSVFYIHDNNIGGKKLSALIQWLSGVKTFLLQRW